MNLILGSSSTYRLQLLKNLGLNPIVIKPNVDESKVKNELRSSSPFEIATQLAFLKSNNIVLNHKFESPFVVIGSDQVCVYNDQILDKPETFENNLKHLKQLQGQTHSLITCVCLLYTKNSSDNVMKIEFFNRTDLRMKSLSEDQIQSYLNLDKPFDCAGGYKFESLGHTLMESVTSEDITSIQGLPMKTLMENLKKIGFSY